MVTTGEGEKKDNRWEGCLRLQDDMHCLSPVLIYSTTPSLHLPSPITAFVFRGLSEHHLPMIISVVVNIGFLGTIIIPIADMSHRVDSSRATIEI
ncbi:unnamed protein product [Linum trigynum]|uniref:PIN-like protein n=1 Tax=Linum trigynum TaxID=586398 RepID=A0AAV2FEY6_9ROSI